nr:flavodoxin domain-containing protein [Mycolicibacterium sphagni]
MVAGAAVRGPHPARHPAPDQGRCGGLGVTRVLVAYGSKRRGTAGLATMIGDALAEAGYPSVVMPARDVRELVGVDAVIVAGALYANRWHRDARRFVRRHATRLRGLPVWLVSSGPLDDSASLGDIPPTKQVAKLVERAGARGHITFGGALAADAKGFPASAMAKTKSGDWRDAEQVRRWVATIVPQLSPAGGS